MNRTTTATLAAFVLASASVARAEFGIGIALALFFKSHLWFNWAAIALVQIPGALAWSLDPGLVSYLYSRFRQRRPRSSPHVRHDHRWIAVCSW